MAYWNITRWIKEVYVAEGETRKEALKDINGPHTIEVTKETCVKISGDTEEANTLYMKKIRDDGGGKL